MFYIIRHSIERPYYSLGVHDDGDQLQVHVYGPHHISIFFTYKALELHR